MKYDTNGKVVLTPSIGSNFIGRFSPDGSMYFTIDPNTGFCGLNAPNGSVYVVDATSSSTNGLLSPNGSLRITTLNENNGALKVSGFATITTSADFTSSTSLPAWLSLSRADATPIATYRNSSGYVQTVATAGAARFDCDYTGTLIGLLLEPSRTNVQLNSNTASGWTATRSTLTANSLLAPTNTTVMSNVVADATASSTHTLSKTASITSGSKYTLSTYAKQSGPYSWLGASLSSTPFGTSQYGSWNLSGAGSLGTFVNGSVGTIERAANSSYRVSLTTGSSSGTTGSYSTLLFLQQADAIQSYNGDSATAAGLYGVQLEAGAYPTSLILNGASAVTRASDILTISGYTTNTIITQEKSIATGLVSNKTYIGSAAFNTAMSGPGIWLQKVTIYS